jgi:hypothetical protein
MGWENHFPLLGRLILVEFTIIVIKASFPAPGISFSCVGVLHRTSHPSGSRHLGQGVEDIILNQLPRPLSVSRTQKISGSSPCPINNNNHRHHGFKPTLWWFTARAGTSPNHLGETVTNQTYWLHQPLCWFTASAKSLRKKFVWIVIHSVSDYKICGPAKLVSQGTVGHHEIGLAAFRL